MIFVSYNPFQMNSGFLYKTKNGQLDKVYPEAPATLNDLAKIAAEYSHTENDFKIAFKSALPNDTEEFTDMVNHYEMLNYKENKIVVKEI